MTEKKSKQMMGGCSTRSTKKLLRKLLVQRDLNNLSECPVVFAVYLNAKFLSRKMTTLIYYLLSSLTSYCLTVILLSVLLASES